MTVHTRFFLLFIFVFTGCSTGLKSIVQNDPIEGYPSGWKFGVVLRDRNTREDLSNTVFGSRLKKATIDYLSTRGYMHSDKVNQRHTMIVFSYESRDRNIHVPGQTYSVPTYGGNSTTTTVKDGYGYKLGTLETSPSNPFAPTGYQTHYRESYDVNVVDRWLFVDIEKFVRGQHPKLISQGQIFPDKVDAHFIEDDSVLKESVEKLLSETPLGKYEFKADENVANLDSEDVQCWPRFGFWVPDGTNIKKTVIKGPIHQLGIRAGDKIVSIDGVEFTKWRQPVYLEKSYEVKFETKGSIVSKDVRPSMLCISDD